MAKSAWRISSSSVCPPAVFVDTPMLTVTTAESDPSSKGAELSLIHIFHFGLATNPWNWVMLAILAVLVMSSLVAVSVQLRRPGVARLGLVGGLFVAAAWLVVSGFTWQGIISPIYSVGAWSGPAVLIGVPLVVGVRCV